MGVSIYSLFIENNARSLYAAPADCVMTTCNEFITGWAVGMHGQCLGDKYGIRIGKSGYRVVVMEVGLLYFNVISESHLPFIHLSLLAHKIYIDPD